MSKVFRIQLALKDAAVESNTALVRLDREQNSYFHRRHGRAELEIADPLKSMDILSSLLDYAVYALSRCKVIISRETPGVFFLKAGIYKIHAKRLKVKTLCRNDGLLSSVAREPVLRLF